MSDIGTHDLPHDDKTALLSLIYGLGDSAATASDERAAQDVELLHAIAFDSTQHPSRTDVGVAAIEALGEHTERSATAVEALIDLLMSTGVRSLPDAAYRQLDRWRARKPDVRTARLQLAIDDRCYDEG